MPDVDEVSIRELRDSCGEIVDRVEAGERVIVTRGGKALAELRRVRTKHLSADVLLQRWARLPVVDPVALRQDMGRVLDPTV